MGVSMQFVIASPRVLLTNRLRQPSDGLAEQDISKTGVRPNYTEDKVRSKAQRCEQMDWQDKIKLSDIQEQTISITDVTWCFIILMHTYYHCMINAKMCHGHSETLMIQIVSG